MGGRVHHVVGTQDDGDIDLAEFAIDVFHLEHLVIRHLGLGQQHVHVAGHATCNGVDRVFDLDAFLGQLGGEFFHRMLRAGDCEAVAGHDDNRFGIAQDKGRIVGAATFDRALHGGTCNRRGRVTAKPTQNHVEE